MGEVYRARDTQLGREVAMAPRRTSADRSRLGDHNQAAARLNIHPNSLRRLIRSLHLRDTLGSDPSRDR